MKRVVIIGGGFAGTTVARRLERENFSVTLIDTKDYFEFTPSILRTLVEPEHIKNIQVLHRHYLHNANVIVGSVTEVSEKKVTVAIHGGKIKELSFDYLVIAAGSHYSLPIKQDAVVVATRAETLRDAHKKLEKSEKIVIIGGGLVGVELAAEIVEKYGTTKEIIIVDAREKIMERLHERAIRYATHYLQKKGVHVMYNEKVIGQTKRKVQTENGKTMEADMVFLCTGIKVNYTYLKKNFSHVLNERNQIKVNDFLQLENYPSIFAAGDVTAINEEKVAQSAEKQAEKIAQNICNKEKNRVLTPYISAERPMIMSLGKWNGIFMYKGYVFTGIIPGLLKGFVEWKEMRKYR